MPEEKKAVIPPAAAADTDLASKVSELEAKLAAETAEKLKERSEKENYRAGLLSRKEQDKKLKRLSQEDLSDPEKLEKVIEEKIQDTKLEEKLTAETEAKAKYYADLEKENAELARSLEAAKTSGGSGGGAGINEHSTSKPQGYFSPAQKAELRKIYESHGQYSPEMIDKMMSRAEDIARQKAGSGALKNDLVPKRTN